MFLNTETSEISKNEGILIKPKRSEVSKFCTELTTITQELLDTKGISFQEACKKLREEYNPKEYVWASHGAYDLNMLKKQCKFKDVEYSMSQEHINTFRES